MDGHVIALSFEVAYICVLRRAQKCICAHPIDYGRLNRYHSQVGIDPFNVFASVPSLRLRSHNLPLFSALFNTSLLYHLTWTASHDRRLANKTNVEDPARRTRKAPETGQHRANLLLLPRYWTQSLKSLIAPQLMSQRRFQRRRKSSPRRRVRRRSRRIRRG